MSIGNVTRVITAAFILFAASCSSPETVRGKGAILRRFPVRDMTGVRAPSGASFDREVTSDGDGSLRLTATRPTLFPLFEILDIDVESSRLVYRAKIRTKDFRGQVFLEMKCDFFTRGELETKGEAWALTGDTEWTEREIEFVLRRSENPKSVWLFVNLAGSGTVWIDDITLEKAPL